MEEEWLEIRDRPDYLISNWGRVYSFKSDLIMQPRPSGWGYMRVCLTENGNRDWRYVHKLVAEHFVPGEDEGLEVNHIDGDKTYNNEINLEWVTKRMNNQHAWDTGLRHGIGVAVIETGKNYKSLKDCADDLGIAYQSVQNALRYKTKTRTGWSFRYVD